VKGNPQKSTEANGWIFALLTDGRLADWEEKGETGKANEGLSFPFISSRIDIYDRRRRKKGKLISFL